MRWVKWSDYSIKTACDTYAISRAVINGADKFTAWRLPKETLGYFDSPQAAKKHVESFHAENQKTAP